MRDLLWRDWSYICYGLLGPIRRGEPVLVHIDDALRVVVDGVRKSDGYHDEESSFRLWCVGNTGSVLVDAGMRQLWAEGWMPRRIRLLAAACLVEGLGIDWRRGRDWFRHTLVDYDPAINEMMWQNAGLCGVDPYYGGIKWEVPPCEANDKTYDFERWMNEELTWPSYLEPYSKISPPPLKLVRGAKLNREALREGGLYKAARLVSKSGVRVAWPGLNNAESSVDEGEVMGVGLVPIHELKV